MNKLALFLGIIAAIALNCYATGKKHHSALRKTRGKVRKEDISRKIGRLERALRRTHSVHAKKKGIHHQKVSHRTKSGH